MPRVTLRDELKFPLPLERCPFCGVHPQTVPFYRPGTWRIRHRCPMVGVIETEWTVPRRLADMWNTRRG